MAYAQRSKEEWKRYYAAERTKPDYKAALSTYQSRLAERAYQAINHPDLPRDMDWFFECLAAKPYSTVIDVGIAYAFDRGHTKALDALQNIKDVFMLTPNQFKTGVNSKALRTDPSSLTAPTTPKPTLDRPANHRASHIAKAAQRSVERNAIR